MGDVNPLLLFLSKFNISDKLFNSIMFAYYHRSFLNLEKPSTLNEKIQWLKTYKNYSAYKKYSDKVSAQKLIGDLIGIEYLINQIGVYNSVDEIQYEALPLKFVLKTNHGSGWNIICNNRDEIDIRKTNYQLSKWLNYDYYKIMHEPNYKNITPKIICEEYVEEENAAHTLDYKFYCFNGKVEFIITNVDRYTNHSQFITDSNWNSLPFSWGYKKFHGSLTKPSQLDEMISISNELSKIHKFIRVDLYSMNNNIYFSELTFFPMSGFCRILPIQWDRILGAKIDIDQIDQIM
jgi:hypothetical protein